jgi:putative ABC transport system ATP-binding protein
MIEMRDLNKSFRTDLVETRALADINLDVGAGQFVAITGPSGSGKTTFLNIAGLLEPFDAGTFRLDGDDVSSLQDSRRSRIRNAKIGFVFQGFNLIPDLTVYDNIDVPLSYRRMAGAERHRRICAALERVGMTSRMRHLPAQLSGGQQQRVAIARALSGAPQVILADEPTGNLDTTMSHQVMHLLKEINADGTTIVMVTHNPELAQMAQRRVHMIDGCIVEDRASEERSPSVAEIHASMGS